MIMPKMPFWNSVACNNKRNNVVKIKRNNVLILKRNNVEN